MNKILLAEDHGLICNGLIHILQNQYPGTSVEVVTGSRSLAEKCMFGNYDLLIADIDLPDMDGLKSVRRIKSLNHTMPVLVISNFPAELYAIRALKAGASGFLNKNTAPEELVHAIDRLRMGKKYISNDIAEKLLQRNSPDKNPHELLTNKELEVMKQVALGKSVTEISRAFSMAIATASAYRTRILNKMNVHSNSELTRYAMTHHIISDADFFSAA